MAGGTVENNVNNYPSGVPYIPDNFETLAIFLSIQYGIHFIVFDYGKSNQKSALFRM